MFTSKVAHLARRVWPLAVLLAGGCAGWQLPKRSELYSRAAALPAAAAWQAARTALSKSGYTIREADEASGRLLGTNELPGPRVEEFARGTGRYRFVTWWRLHVELLVTVAGQPEGPSRIMADTRLRGEGSSLYPDRTTMVSEVPLMSSGALERAYLETLDLYLADAQGTVGSDAASDRRTTTMRLVSHGRVRVARLVLPDGEVAAHPRPLLLAFHGDAGSGRRLARLTGLTDAAGTSGWLVAYPEGTGWQGLPPRSWNAGICCGYANAAQVDDVAFIRELLDELATRYAVDPARIYATGISNGAMFAYRLACELSDRIAAIAPVAGTMDLSACRPTDPVSVIAFHGTADAYVPYLGGPVAEGGESRRDPPVEEVIAFWMRHNGSRSGTDVVLHRIESGGHAWPSTATARILEFFAGHAKRAPADS